MKRLPVLISFFTLSATSHPAFADTEFVGSVPLEVVEQFIGNPFGGQGTLYSDILDAFPPFTVPEEFTVLASADQGYVQRVILSSTLDAGAAAAALTAAFAAEGWVEIPVYGMPAQQTGFVSAEQPAVVPRQLCHDDHGTLTVLVNASNGTSYININRNVGVPGMAMVNPSCTDRLAQTQNAPRMGFGGGSMLNAYVPKLIMPQSTLLPAPPTSMMASAGGGSSNDWEARGALAIDWSIDEIYAHFAMQIAEQGWSADSEATGALVANGSWTKNIDDMDLIGALSIVKLADNTWDLRFRLVRQGGARGGPAVNRIIDQVR